MDRMRACGALDVGSIPTGGTLRLAAPWLEPSRKLAQCKHFASLAQCKHSDKYIVEVLEQREEGKTHKRRVGIKIFNTEFIETSAPSINSGRVESCFRRKKKRNFFNH